MSIIEEYTEAIVLERSEDDSENKPNAVAIVSFGSFILRVAVPSDN